MQCNGRSLYRYKGHRLGGSMREHKGHKLGGSTRASKIHKGCWQVGGTMDNWCDLGKCGHQPAMVNMLRPSVDLNFFQSDNLPYS